MINSWCVLADGKTEQRTKSNDAHKVTHFQMRRHGITTHWIENRRDALSALECLILDFVRRAKSHAGIAAMVRKYEIKTDDDLRAIIGDDWMMKAYANSTIVRTVQNKIRLGRGYQ